MLCPGDKDDETVDLCNTVATPAGVRDSNVVLLTDLNWLWLEGSETSASVSASAATIASALSETHPIHILPLFPSVTPPPSTTLIKVFFTGQVMARELKSKEEFLKLLPSAREIRLIKTDKSVKVKIRGRDYLYTLKTTDEEAEALIKGAKADVVEY